MDKKLVQQAFDAWVERHETETSGYLQERRLESILNRLEDDTSDSDFLEVGCGTGVIFGPLLDRFRRGFGVDLSRRMLAYLRKGKLAGRQNHLLAQADAERLPFGDSRFDCLLSVELLQYLGQPGPFLEESARVLKPGGMMIVVVWSRHYSLIQKARIMLGIGFTDIKKPNYPGPGAIEEALKDCGFTEVDVEGVSFFPVAPRPLRPLLSRIDRFLSRSVLKRLAVIYMISARREV